MNGSAARAATMENGYALKSPITTHFRSKRVEALRGEYT